MDAHAVLKMEAASTPTVYSQLQEMYRRHRMTRQKKRVRLNDILEAVERASGADDSRMINPELLSTIVENIQPSQAERTIGNANKFWSEQ